MTEGSAATYRLASNASYNLDRFNFDAKATANAFLLDAINNNAETSLRDRPGRYAGSWTIPVCNTSTWGNRWNYNIKDPQPGSIEISEAVTLAATITRHTKGSPPCICGKPARFYISGRLLLVAVLMDCA